MYFYNYGPLNPSLMPNKEKFGDMGCFVSQKRISFSSGKKKKKKRSMNMSVKCLSSQSPRSNLSLVLPKSGSSSFPGETKLLLYHSGPQVFQCSLTVSCKRRGTGNICWCQSLTAPRTNALCNASTFSKGSRVPYHWLRSQLACNSILLRLIDQTHNETLSCFCFFIILNHDLISAAAVWFGADGANKRSED